MYYFIATLGDIVLVGISGLVVLGLYKLAVKVVGK